MSAHGATPLPQRLPAHTLADPSPEIGITERYLDRGLKYPSLHASPETKNRDSQASEKKGSQSLGLMDLIERIDPGMMTSLLGQSVTRPGPGRKDKGLVGTIVSEVLRGNRWRNTDRPEALVLAMKERSRLAPGSPRPSRRSLPSHMISSRHRRLMGGY